MMTIHGTGVSAGVAEGPLYFLTRPVDRPVRETASDPASELRRFEAAREEAVSGLLRLSGECRAQLDQDAALLFEAHALLAGDEDFTARIEDLIRSASCPAEQAVRIACDEFAGRFSAMTDEYLRARAADVRDVSRQILDRLTGCEGPVFAPGKPVVLAADDLAPSETVRLDRSKILALVTRSGSPSSHTAILARTMGIPAVCALGEALRADWAGRTALVDGETGQVIVEPDENALLRHREKARIRREDDRNLRLLRTLEDVTPDGQRISLLCNIGSPDDLPAVLESGASGVGLFRSEFLYLAADGYPDEETQFASYRQAASALNGRRVVIRTLDMGADKQAGYFHLKKEENPALGMRAVRLCLTRPGLFRTQLRALYRASAYGKISLLFPLIASVWELEECRAHCRAVMDELDRENIPFDRSVETGVMIETPASVLIADELAQRADFFSVGTNDLTQYLLACDRQMSDPGRFYDPQHPAVLRALKTAADAAHENGIWIGVCGELAADPSMLPFFLSLRIDELSVPPAAVLPLRRAVRAFQSPKGAD